MGVLMSSLLTTDSLTGQNVGPYQIRRPLGRGVLNAVYEACHESTQQVCILTLFLIPEAFPAQARQRFLARFARESAVLMKLRHPYILPVQDVGEYADNPYLVNPNVKGSSVAKLLKQKGRLTPEQTLELLKRIADSIDYAHSNGVIHGTLSPTNILLNETVQIAGFGLMNMLTVRGLEDAAQRPQLALHSIAGTVLGTQGYIAPEVIQGKPFDGRIDIYGLGILLLELLYGSSPFNGTPDLATRSMEVPRLSILCPELPASLDTVIQQAVDPDAERRIQSAGALATLFAQALNAQQTASKPIVVTQKVMPDPQMTLPNAVDWFVKEDTPTGKWQLIPPITVHTAAIRSMNAQEETLVERENTQTDDTQSIDPFVWWSSMTASQVAAQPGTFAKTAQRPSTSKKRVVAQKQSRRRVVAMLAGGGVVALGALGFGGATLAHVLQHGQRATTSTVQQQPVATTAPTSVPTRSTGGVAQTGPTATAKPKPTAKPTQATQATPTAGTTTQPTTQPTAQPTQPPKPTPTPPPQHTGTVIGSTSMATDSSKNFANPANGSSSILIHLSNGNFVAYNNACTHEGVAVYYDAGSQKLKCPRHGAIFDPVNGGSPVSGPNNGPLANVAIRVNSDGTITTG